MSDGVLDFITSALGMNDDVADAPERAAESMPVERTPEGSGVIDGSTPTATLPTIRVLASSCKYGCGKKGIPILPVVFSRDDYRVSRKDKRYFGDGLSAKSAKHDAIASLPTYTYLYCLYDYIDDYGDERKSVREIFTGKDGALKRVTTYYKDDFEEKKEKDTNKIEVTNIDEPDDDTLDEMVQPATCDRDEHSTLDSKYIILDAGEIVWLMVSHAQLSKAALKKYFYDEALRDKRMQKFVADDLIDNKNTKSMSEYFPEIEYINSSHQRKQLEQGGDIGDKFTVHEKYSKTVVGEDEDGEVEESTLKEDANGAINSAFQLYKNMERGINDKISEIEKNINEGYGDSEDDKLFEESEKHQLKILKDTKPMMVALHDPVGEVLAAAEKRNYLLKKLDDAQKNKGQIREQVNAIIIDNIRMRVEAGTGYDSSRSQSPSELAYHIDGKNKVSQANNKNIYDYIDRSRFKSVLSAAKKSKSDKRDIAKARQIFVDAIGYNKNKQGTLDFAFVMREDFPENDEESHLGYAQIIAEATQGIGIDESNIGIPDAIWSGYKPKEVAGMTAEQEFRQSLLPCISGEQPTADNWFFKALIGLDKEDLNRFENPPYENLARASDASGAVAQWVEMFDKKKKQKNIAKNASISVAAKVDEINKIAANQARIIETYSNNQQYIQTEHGLLNRGEVYIRASVAKTSGWKQGFLKVLHIPFKHQVKKNITKASLNMDSKLLPAAIDKEAILAGSSVSRRSAPFAIDFAKTFNLDATAVRTVNDAASGNRQAVLDVVTYLGDDAVNKATSLSRQLSQSGTELDSLLRTIDDNYRQLDRRSAGKAAMISAAVMAFQLRSTLINKDKISAMVARGDRASLEFMTAYTSTTLALTSASLDVANAGLQMKVARSAWVARLSLSVGVLGAVGAGFEIYSLSISLERQLESKSYGSAVATGVAAGAALTAGITGTAIALGFAMPWVVGIMAVAWAVSFFAGWIASNYDKSNILPVHYWLDAGVFGNKKMIDVNDYPNNPFSNSAKKITPMASLEQDMHAYALALTSIRLEPRFTTRAEGFNKVLSGQLTAVISQWEDNSKLEVQYIGIGDQEQILNTKTVSIGILKQQNKTTETLEGLQITLDIPETSHFKEPAWQSIKDSSWEYHNNRENRIEEARQAARSDPDSQIEQLRVVALYSLNPDAHPHYQLRTTVTSQ